MILRSIKLIILTILRLLRLAKWLYNPAWWERIKNSFLNQWNQICQLKKGAHWGKKETGIHTGRERSLKSYTACLQWICLQWIWRTIPLSGGIDLCSIAMLAEDEDHFQKVREKFHWSLMTILAVACSWWSSLFLVESLSLTVASLHKLVETVFSTRHLKKRAGHCKFGRPGFLGLFLLSLLCLWF